MKKGKELCAKRCSSMWARNVILLQKDLKYKHRVFFSLLLSIFLFFNNSLLSMSFSILLALFLVYLHLIKPMSPSFLPFLPECFLSPPSYYFLNPFTSSILSCYNSFFPLISFLFFFSLSFSSSHHLFYKSTPLSFFSPCPILSLLPSFPHVLLCPLLLSFNPICPQSHAALQMGSSVRPATIG